jgi:hypothetical protein
MGRPRSKVLKQRVKVLQSNRSDEFGDVTVLGSQYRDHSGVLHWYFAVWSEQNTNVRFHRVSGGEVPIYVDSADREALLEAIGVWESSPAPQPK